MLKLPRENFLRPWALVRFFGTTIVGVLLDLWSKQAAYEKLALWMDGRFNGSRNAVQFIPGWLHFEVTKNEGAVFGLGQGHRMVFLTVSVGAITFLTYLFANSRRQRVYEFVLGMLLAGVLGNMYDRIVFGYVRDMIHALPQWPTLFPWIFNVADVLLCTGVGLMLVLSLYSPKEGGRGFEVVPAAETKR
ncbi:MAG: signal peptidase II [Tepidisphaerales bacterium]